MTRNLTQYSRELDDSIDDLASMQSILTGLAIGVGAGQGQLSFTG